MFGSREWHIAFNLKELQFMRAALVQYHKNNRMEGEQGARVADLISKVESGLSYYRETK